MNELDAFYEWMKEQPNVDYVFLQILKYWKKEWEDRGATDEQRV